MSDEKLYKVLDRLAHPSTEGHDIAISIAGLRRIVQGRPVIEVLGLGNRARYIESITRGCDEIIDTVKRDCERQVAEANLQRAIAEQRLADTLRTQEKQLAEALRKQEKRLLQTHEHEQKRKDAELQKQQRKLAKEELRRSARKTEAANDECSNKPNRKFVEWNASTCAKLVLLCGSANWPQQAAALFGPRTAGSYQNVKDGIRRFRDDEIRRIDDAFAEWRSRSRSS